MLARGWNSNNEPAVVCGPAAGSSAASLPKVLVPATGPIVADDGFRPPANGFPFQNYGSDLIDGSGPASSLTPADMQRLFGNAVCGDPQCDLTPDAQAFMDQTNQSMAGGHCFGFSVASQLFWTGKANPTDFGAASTPALNIDGNSKLMGEIADAWTFQNLPSVQHAAISGDPNTILSQLKTPSRSRRPGAPSRHSCRSA